MNHNWTHEEKVAWLVTRAKAEILEDIEKGIVPASVSTFGDLHEYVDANCYGGACEDDIVEWGFDGMTERYIDAVHEAQDRLNQWMVDGRAYA